MLAALAVGRRGRVEGYLANQSPSLPQRDRPFTGIIDSERRELSPSDAEPRVTALDGHRILIPWWRCTDDTRRLDPRTPAGPGPSLVVYRR